MVKAMNTRNLTHTEKAWTDRYAVENRRKRSYLILANDVQGHLPIITLFHVIRNTALRLNPMPAFAKGLFFRDSLP